MMWIWIVFIVVVILVGGCAIVMGSGTASLQVERKVEVASGNEAKVEAELPSKDKK
jgi:uncharacterized protein YceK